MWTYVQYNTYYVCSVSKLLEPFFIRRQRYISHFSFWFFVHKHTHTALVHWFKYKSFCLDLATYNIIYYVWYVSLKLWITFFLLWHTRRWQNANWQFLLSTVSTEAVENKTVIYTQHTHIHAQAHEIISGVVFQHEYELFCACIQWWKNTRYRLIYTSACVYVSMYTEICVYFFQRFSTFRTD